MARKQYRIAKLEEKLVAFGMRREAVEVLMAKCRSKGKIDAEEIIAEMLREGIPVDRIRKFFVDLGVDEACVAEAIALAGHPEETVRPVKVWPGGEGMAPDFSRLKEYSRGSGEGKKEDENESENEKLRKALLRGR